MLSFIGGVDEAGRGPLAGPVVAAAVVIPVGLSLPGVRDSKKLSAGRRTELALLIRESATAWATGMASASEIDSLNILHATMLAMERAVAGLHQVPDLLRVDGNRLPEFGAAYAGRAETLVGGDDKCPAIAAASILAKVDRDSIMDELHDEYPEYGFDRHRGYPTARHRQALREYGPTVAHRFSFRPVREAGARFTERLGQSTGVSN